MQVAVKVRQDPAPDWTHEAVFASERQSAAQARSFVSGRLVDHRLLGLLDPVRAVISELSANAIVHARTSFAVTLSRTGPVLLLSVQDAAPDSKAVRRSVGVMAEGGYGLNLVASLSRAWGVTTAANDSKSVWASFDVRPHGERRGPDHPDSSPVTPTNPDPGEGETMKSLGVEVGHSAESDDETSTVLGPSRWVQ
jgi:hypothetical protein